MQLLVRTLLTRPVVAAPPLSAHLRRLSPLRKPCIPLRFPAALPPRHQRRFYSSDKDPKPNPPADATASHIIQPEDLHNLPSQQESRRSDVSKRFSAAMDDLQAAVFTAGQKLNILTGYSDIESLKKSIERQENRVRDSRLAVQQAKEDYQNAINRRSMSQREVNELLQRKHAWSPADLERFTQLYRSDHTNEQDEAAAQERLAQAEREADEAQAKLASSILARYHEEQIWSDKIRRASTWGTWVLMGFNVLLFIVVQLGLEPWKRRRLVGGFEEKVREVIQEESNKHNGLFAARSAPVVAEAESKAEEAVIAFVDAAPAVEDLVVEEAPEAVEIATPEHKLRASMVSILAPAGYSLEMLKDHARALVSENEIMVAQKEITYLAAGSAAVGAVVTGLVSFIIISSR